MSNIGSERLEGGIRATRQGDKGFTSVLPIVSVITVVYNGDQFIESTIKSVVNQSYQNVEYIIIDGLSTDNTLSIIRQYDDQIDYWLSERDKGIYDAMNRGLVKAQGDYVWFINAGDLISEKDTLEKLMLNSAKDADIYYGETYLIDMAGKVLGTRSDRTTRKLPKDLTWRNMSRGMVVSHQSILVRKNIAPLYNLNYSCSADVDWVINSLKAAKTIVNVKFVLTKYLIGGHSIQLQKMGWWERFKIYVKHYGLLATFWNHLFIIVRALKFAFKK